MDFYIDLAKNDLPIKAGYYKHNFPVDLVAGRKYVLCVTRTDQNTGDYELRLIDIETGKTVYYKERKSTCEP